jgi:hypothetical protein
MRFVGIEYDVPNTNKRLKGFLRIPENFPPYWIGGFIEYLRDSKNITGNIDVYPLNVRTMTPDKMGKPIAGYDDLEDDFNLAIRSNKYYPSCPQNDAIRRCWSKLDPTTPTYAPKERWS